MSIDIRKKQSEWVTLTSYRNPQTLPDIAANAGDWSFYYSTYSDAESNEYLFLILSADQQAAIAAKYKLSSDNLTSLPLFTR